MGANLWLWGVSLWSVNLLGANSIIFELGRYKYCIIELVRFKKKKTFVPVRFGPKGFKPEWFELTGSELEILKYFNNHFQSQIFRFDPETSLIWTWASVHKNLNDWPGYHQGIYILSIKELAKRILDVGKLPELRTTDKQRERASMQGRVALRLSLFSPFSGEQA